jgi:hypothetical protein
MFFVLVGLLVWIAVAQHRGNRRQTNDDKTQIDGDGLIE